MFRPLTGLSVILCLLPLGLTGCKIVPDPDPAEAEAAGDQSDEGRMAAYAAGIWQDQLLPVVAEKLLPLTALRAALASDAEAAGEAHGLRPKGEAYPWNFMVSGEGVITEAKVKSRAAKLEVDTDSDGKADVTLQLGPVIRGTALRDAMPFILFTDYRDQIEFAKLANALNAEAHSRLTIPESDVTGQVLRFEGAFTLQGKAEKIELVPTLLEIGAKDG